MTEITMPIPARLKNVATGGHVAGADDIIDDVKGKTQDVINSEVDIALGTKIPSSEKGANNGVATLDSTGKVPSSQLPSYVDDVIDGYYYNEAFYSDSEHTTQITPESDKIYIDVPTGASYRWSGSVYVLIGNPDTYTKSQVDTIVSTAKSDVIGGATSDGNTLKKIEDRTATLETAVGTGGSVDTRITNAINALDSTASQSAGNDGLALSVTETDGKVTAISGSIAANTYDTYGSASAAQSAAESTAAADATSKVNAAKTELLGDAATDYNTLGKLEDKIQAEATRAEAAEEALDGRVDTLEEAVGSGGSVDERIAEAVENAAFLGENDGSAVIADFDPQSDTVWKKAQILSAAEKAQVKANLGVDKDIENLQELYQALTQSDIEVVNSVPASGVANKIYRVVGQNSYADYMFNSNALTTPIKMAEYDNAIDDEPTAGSNNLVKSGGVFDAINELSFTRVLSSKHFVLGTLDGSTGRLLPNKHAYISLAYFIRIDSSDKYIFELPKEAGYTYKGNLYYYDSSKNYLSRGTFVEAITGNYTIPSNATYIKLVIGRQVGNTETDFPSVGYIDGLTPVKLYSYQDIELITQANLSLLDKGETYSIIGRGDEAVIKRYPISGKYIYLRFDKNQFEQQTITDNYTILSIFCGNYGVITIKKGENIPEVIAVYNFNNSNDIGVYLRSDSGTEINVQIADSSINPSFESLSSLKESGGHDEEEFIRYNETDLPTPSEIQSLIINRNNNKWTSSSSSSYLYLLNGIKYLRLAASAYGGTDYAFLTSDSHSADSTPSYSSGTTIAHISPGEDAGIIEVPQDAVYFYTIKGTYPAIIAYNDKSVYTSAEEINIVKKYSELETKFDAVCKKIGFTSDHVFTLVHGSDFHVDKDRYRNFNNFINYYKNRISAAIVTGDFLSYPSEEQFNQIFSVETVDDIIKIKGNHEKAMPPIVVSNEDVYTRLGYVTNTGKSYFYKDFVDYGIRLIGIDQYDIQTDNVTIGGHTGHYSSTQISWLLNTLDDAIQNNLTVIIAMHSPESIPSENNIGFRQIVPDALGRAGYVCSGTPIEDIIDAFKRGTSINNTYTYDDIEEQLSVQHTFSGGGKFAAIVCGHYHGDYIGYSSNYPAILYLNCTCGCLEPYNVHPQNIGEGYSDLPRVKESVSEDAFNVYGFDLTSNKVKVLRVGSNINHNLEIRDYAMYNI